MRALAREMRATVATHEVGACAAALRASAELYRALRAKLAAKNLRMNAAAEDAAMTYLTQIEERCLRRP